MPSSKAQLIQSICFALTICGFAVSMIFQSMTIEVVTKSRDSLLESNHELHEQVMRLLKEKQAHWERP